MGRTDVAQSVVDHSQPERGEPAVRTLAMPADTNPSGDIFGGWVLAQMDLAAGIVAAQRAKGRVATAALDGMSFHKPVYVGDLVSCYAKVVHIGRTSMIVQVDTFVLRSRARQLRSQLASGGTGRGRPCSSIATRVKRPSVTLTSSPVRLRRTKVSTWTIIDVRPTWTTLA